MTKDCKLEKISIVTHGSRGDIQPYLALGIALKARGYQVRMVSNVNFQGLVESFDIAFVGITVDAQQVLRENPKLLQAQYDGNFFSLLAGMSSAMKEAAPESIKRFKEELTAHTPDLIIKGTLSEYLAYYAALEFGVPFVDVALAAIVHNPKRCLLGLPTLPFGLHRYFLTHAIFPGVYDAQRHIDEVTGKGVLKRYTLQQFLRDHTNPTFPRIILSPSSPSLGREHLYGGADAHYNLKFVGNAIIPLERQHDNPHFSNRETQDAIQAFLEKDKEKGCVYIGWGSMLSKSPEFMTEFAVRALQKSGQRGIVLAGYADLSIDKLVSSSNNDDDNDDYDSLIRYATDNVLFVKSCSHEWLFPRVKASVHHGGAGTTAAALRSGNPTIITPVLFDQWDNAYLVNCLGVGIGFERRQLQKTSYEQLGDAIKTVVSDPAIAKRAQQVAKELKKEDGAHGAVVEIERFWEDAVVSGRFQQEFPGESIQSSSTRSNGGSNKRMRVAIAVSAVSVVAGLVLLRRKG